MSDPIQAALITLFLFVMGGLLFAAGYWFANTRAANTMLDLFVGSEEELRQPFFLGGDTPEKTPCTHHPERYCTRCSNW